MNTTFYVSAPNACLAEWVASIDLGFSLSCKLIPKERAPLVWQAGGREKSQSVTPLRKGCWPRSLSCEIGGWREWFHVPVSLRFHGHICTVSRNTAQHKSHFHLSYGNNAVTPHLLVGKKDALNLVRLSM